MVRRPDFAATSLERIEDRDLRFIIEQFPAPGGSFEEISKAIDSLPSTLESMLSSDYLFNSIYKQRDIILEISPFLYFSVILRRIYTERPTALERRTLNYLANLLTIFIRAERLHQVQPYDQQTYEYIVDLIAECGVADSRRRFLIHAHIGNYTLFVTGLFPRWIEHRHRYKRRLVDMQYYVDCGRAYFHQASKHPLAGEYQLSDVFLRLAIMFDAYKNRLNQLSSDYLFCC